jgi:hypothetical protein
MAPTNQETLVIDSPFPGDDKTDNAASEPSNSLEYQEKQAELGPEENPDSSENIRACLQVLGAFFLMLNTW